VEDLAAPLDSFPPFSSLVLDLPSTSSPSMHSSSLFAYFPLVLSFGIGVLAQAEMAECLAGWEWVRLFFISYDFLPLGGGYLYRAPKPRQGINNNTWLH